jgi:hypothetical protein
LRRERAVPTPKRKTREDEKPEANAQKKQKTGTLQTPEEYESFFHLATFCVNRLFLPGVRSPSLAVAS